MPTTEPDPRLSAAPGSSGVALAESIERSITRLTWLEHKRFATELEAFELTPAQYHTLIYVARRGHECTMGCLAEHLHQSSATTTGIVDRLVRQGLAERRDDPGDRRRVIVRLTERGGRLLAEVGSERRQGTEAILAGFREEDGSRFASLLDAYLDRVAELIAARERPR